MTSLDGTWEMIRAESGGENSPELVGLGVQLEISGNAYTVRFGGEIADRGIFLITPDNTLTLIGSEGANSGRTIQCIYQLVGDRLRICYGLDGKMPTEFRTALGLAHYLATYRRSTPKRQEILNETATKAS